MATGDQIVGAGGFNIIFFSLTALLEGKSVREAAERVKTQLNPQMLRHWLFWPWFHLLNVRRCCFFDFGLPDVPLTRGVLPLQFYFNTLHVRVVFQNLALVGWSALLSSVGAASKEGKRNAARL